MKEEFLSVFLVDVQCLNILKNNISCCHVVSRVYMIFNFIKSLLVFLVFI